MFVSPDMDKVAAAEQVRRTFRHLELYVLKMSWLTPLYEKENVLLILRARKVCESRDLCSYPTRAASI